MMRPEFDVAIIGGGPAGAATAAYLAKAGINCVVFEREVFPRPHVGESLVPSSTRVFRELGFLEEMERAQFPRKYGAVWTASANSPVYSHDWDGLESDSYADIRFSEREQPGAPLGYTYHVDRGKFDQLLLEHAGRLGAKIRYGVTVTAVDWAGPEVRLIHRKHGGRMTGTTTARMIVDASGRRTFLGTRLKLRVPDRVFDQYALHTWFEGYDRGVLAKSKEHEGYIFVHFLPITNSWIWQIPITDSVTSIGIVNQKNIFLTHVRHENDSFGAALRVGLS